MRIKLSLQWRQIPAWSLIVFSVPVFQLATHRAYAQICYNTMTLGPVTFPIAASKVLVGQTITIARVSFGLCDAGSCPVRRGEGYLVYPDGSFVKVVTNLTLNPPGASPPPGSFLNCFGTNSVEAEGICFAFTNYIVRAADVGKSNVIILPPRGEFPSGLIIPFGGVPGRIYFGASVEADGINLDDPSVSTGASLSLSSLFLSIATPGISLTNVCDPSGSTCGGTNFAYGDPIAFKGTICNVGDVTLVNIGVADSWNAVITFATTTSSGNPFNPAIGLTNGECVNYSGSYQPSGNLSGPFSDSVVASGVASGVFGNPTFSATNSATCSVCQPQFTSSSLLGSELILSGSGGGSNASYTAFTTSNLATPIHLWVPVLTDTFAMDGHFTFTNHLQASNSQGYFRLEIR